MLVQIPIKCSQNILNSAELTFNDDGSARVSDTCNSYGGKFTLTDVIENGKFGTITMTGGTGTQMACEWETDEATHTAHMVDEFIQSLFKQPFGYTLHDDFLIIFKDNQEYHFKEITHQVNNVSDLFDEYGFCNYK